MTDNDPDPSCRKPDWRIGELSFGEYSREDLLALAQSFVDTVCFLDAVEDILKRIDVILGLRPTTEESYLAFLDPPPDGTEVAFIRSKLTAFHLAWKVASDLNRDVASFNGDLLHNLNVEIRRVNRDAIDAARNGTELQKVKAVYNSRKDINDAFFKLNRELCIHRERYVLAERVRGVNGRKRAANGSAQPDVNNSSNRLHTDADPGVPASWLSPRSVADLAIETGCSRTTINDEVKNGNIPGGALRENNKPRGNVILQQTGLDYLKRKGGKDRR